MNPIEAVGAMSVASSSLKLALDGRDVRSFCEQVSRGYPERVIYDRDGGSPYLSRFYMLGGPRSMEDDIQESGQPRAGAEWHEFPVNLYLHKFHRGDDDLALHNHPWQWSVSIILVGGYREERRATRADGSFEVVERVVRPFDVNLILANDYHRVDLLEADCWSLFIAGPKTQSWSFWDRDTGVTKPWRQFIDEKRGKVAPQRPRDVGTRCGNCNACDIERQGCGCDGALDDGCFLCTPSVHQRPPCPGGVGG